MLGRTREGGEAEGEGEARRYGRGRQAKDRQGASGNEMRVHSQIAMKERKMPSDRFYRADMYPFHEGPEWIIMMHINPTLAR